MVWSSHDTVQDRTIYEDVIFAKMLHEDGSMDARDFSTYVGLFNNMTNFLHRPDLIIYLDIEPEVALQRVRSRGRACENGLTLDYLVRLRDGYEEWLQDVEGRIPVLRIDWNNFQDTADVVEQIRLHRQHTRGLVL